VRKLQRAGIEKCVRVEFAVAAPHQDGGLRACGLLVVNPPWRLAAEIRTFSPPLIELLKRDSHGGYTLEDLCVAATAAGV
jgi:23S rRNA (adenine2030-N6)-methyltransferase